MKHILNSMFLQETINSIDEKYKNIVDFEFEKYFTYSNLFQMPLYYNLFTYKKDPDYGLVNKIQTKKHFETIIFLIKEIRENNYNSNYLLFLYSYICNMCLNCYIKGYQNAKVKANRFTSKKNKMFRYSKIGKYIEAQFYEEQTLNKIKYFKIDVNKLHLEDECFVLIDELCKNIYYNSFAVDVYKISYKKFINYQHKNYSSFRFVHKLYTYILDLITYSKKESATSIYNISSSSKKDYLNKENKLWLDGESESYKSFNQLYQEALSMAVNLINLVSSDIFYNSKNEVLIKKLTNEIKSRF